MTTLLRLPRVRSGRTLHLRSGGAAAVLLALAACQPAQPASGPAARPGGPGTPPVAAADTTPADTADPFAGNYRLVQANDIALVWTAPSSSSTCAPGSTPFDPRQQFAQSLCLAVGTWATTSDTVGNLTALAQADAGLLAQLPLNAFYDTTALSLNVGAATGDFDGDGRADLVTAAFDATSGNIVVATGGGSTSAIAGSLQTAASSAGTPRLAMGLAAGDFDGDGKDEAVLSWVDTHLNVLSIAVDSATLAPTLGPVYQGDAFANPDFYPQVAAATGDFDGDGAAELALAWSADTAASARTTRLVLQVFRVDAAGNVTAQGRLAADSLAVGQPVLESSDPPGVAGQVAMTTGDIDGNGASELLLAWGTPAAADISGQTIASVLPAWRIYTVAPSLASFSQRATATDTTGWDYLYAGIAAGDFDLDGTDEFVVLNAGNAGASGASLGATLYSYQVSSGSVLTRASYSTTDFVAPTVTNWPAGSFWTLADVEVGDLNADLRSEIVMAWRPSAQTCFSCVHLGIFTVSTDLTTITDTGLSDDTQQLMAYSAGPENWIGGHVDVVLGDFSGNGTWVGPPTRYRVDEVQQILALVNEPPKHADWWTDSTGRVTDSLNVNNDSSSFVLYENTQSASTNMTASVSRDWGYSDGLAASLGEDKVFDLSASIETTYGQGFTKTHGTLNSLTFGSNAYALMDDYVILLELGYTVWEYPVFTGPGGQPKGYLLVVFPDEPTGDGVITYLQGTQLGSYYRPPHEPGNLLSYRSTNPPDIDTLILQQVNKYQVGPGGMVDEYVDWSTVKTTDSTATQTQSITKSEGANASFTNVFTLGLGITAKSTYTETDISTLTTTFQQETSLHVYMAGFPNGSYTYFVTPLVYWSQGGWLVVDYAVQIPQPVPSNGWMQRYGQLPDPAFSLPQRTPDTTAVYRAFTREIDFEWDTQGNPIAIDVTIHNYSLLQAGAQNVLVRCYDGDPAHGGVQIGSDQTIASIPAQGTGGFRLGWAPTDSATHYIYCLIDPAGTIQEVHEWNNRAWAKYPPDELGGSNGAPPSERRGSVGAGSSPRRERR